MKYVQRRTVLEMLAASTMLGTARLQGASFDQTISPALPAMLRSRSSQQISGSHLSVGFETLDRKMFDPERTYNDLAQLGVKWARCQTGWARTEQQAGQFDFAWLDSVVDRLLSIDIQPWFNLGYGNPLCSPGADRYAVGWAPVFSSEAKTAWLRYVDRLSQHFSSRVRHWEIWNEPNNKTFWRPQAPSADDYVTMVARTAHTLRRNVPGAVIIGGAFAGIPMDYIEQCLAAGLADHIDKISFHPYRARPEENFADDYRALRGLVDKFRPGLSLWQGEDGALSTAIGTGALSNLQWTEEGQAKWLLRRILTDLGLGIELTSYFHTVDLQKYDWGGGPTGATNSKGLLRGGSYTRKPSFNAYQNLCALFDIDTVPTRALIRFDRPEQGLEIAAISSATFSRHSHPIYAFWFPSGLQQPWVFRNARVTVWSPKDLRLENPVLVNLLSGQVSAPAAVERNGGYTSFPDTSITDYPMLLTDAALLQ